MAPRDDDVISSLRSCKFEGLTAYRDMGTRLLAGNHKSLESLIHLFETARFKKDAGSILEALEQAEDKPDDLIRTLSTPAGLADYSTAKDLYPDLQPTDLPALINAHLHHRFQTQFTAGIGILSPLLKDLAPVYTAARDLAASLAACPTSPLPESCPPNLPHCTSCKEALDIQEPAVYTNSSHLFTLGLVPHPYTTLSLSTFDINLAKDPFDRLVKHIRRKAERDVYTRAVTEKLVKLSIGAAPRLAALKETVAAKGGKRVVGMWGTEEGFVDVEWSLGFAPKEVKAEPVQVQQTGKTRLLDAKEVLRKHKAKILKVVESWSLADTELWGFVRAWEARKAEIRREWEHEEKRFGQGVET